MKQSLILCFLIVFARFLSGQTPDSLLKSTVLATDSTSLVLETPVPEVKKEKKRFLKNLFNFKKDYPSPKKAVILSAILPGTGQVYNKKYWKLPLVYGALGTMGYFIGFSTNQYKRFRKAYIYRLDDNPITIDEFTKNDVELLNTAAIKAQRDLFQKRKELSYIGAVLAYVLVGVDAFVDAHLLSFDVSDDLSLQIQPEARFLPNREGALGLSFSFQYYNKKTEAMPVAFY